MSTSHRLCHTHHTEPKVKLRLCSQLTPQPADLNKPSITQSLTNNCDEHPVSKHWALLLKFCHERQHVGGQLGALLVQDC